MPKILYFRSLAQVLSAMLQTYLVLELDMFLVELLKAEQLTLLFLAITFCLRDSYYFVTFF